MAHPADSSDLHSTLIAPPDPMIGAVIDGRYVVEKVLGEGGMGLVYRAHHAVLNKPLAVKVLRAEVSNNPQVIARFRQEAQSASAIGNQHIIDVLDFGALPDGATYFVMEYLDGLPLTAVIERDSPLPIPRLVHVARQLCDALGAAHGAGIVHRDLKPDNVFLVRRGAETDFVKVLDFGIAKVGGSSSKLTQAGQVFGTPHYMAPEQCQGQPVDPRADVYALGVILYELLTGTLPFESESLVGLLTAHLTEPPPPPSSRRPDCPQGLEAILLRCLEKRPDARYPDCASLAHDLDGFASGLPTWVPPRVSGIVEARGAAHSARPMPTPPPAAAPGPSLKTIALAAGALLMLAGALAFAAFVYVRSQERPAQVPVVVLPRLPEIAVPSVAVGPSATIHIESEPSGAEVVLGGELVGLTPLDMPRPAAGEHRDLVLRNAGYEDRAVTVSSATREETLRFELRRTSSANPRARGPGQGVSQAPTSAPFDAEDRPGPRRPSSEVINPWAN